MILETTPEGLQRQYDELQEKINACGNDYFLMYGYVKQQAIINQKLVELAEQKEKNND